ncbi:MAG: acetyl-CoA carboxylase biotin carboxylase subunit [Brevefilum sp.]|nr:acetyl-CoA carboxylase biotin carboxylase subunit [Brevefilum sp.]
MKILVANRGEIALRILRTCRELGFPSVAVYSAADQDSLPARYADEAVSIGGTPARESYLNTGHVLKAAIESGAEAVHPGYGFLSENADFAQAVEDAGLIFIGPSPETLALTGDKLAARRIARQAGLPVLPGPDQAILETVTDAQLAKVNYPVLIKAVSGGGGRGIRLANNLTELEEMILAARQEAKAAFGDDSVYFEPLVQQARHVEIQILGDGHGRILALGERECSIQRRHQKLIEESPAPSLSPTMRQNLYQAALTLGKTLNYRSLGTVEFLLNETGGFYFIEVNPRIQVEHPVTEMVTGVDLVSAQLRLAAGQPFKYAQKDIHPRGSAIEARVLAEDPENGFLPATGEITYLKEPGGPGVRVDSALYVGQEITADYDSLIAKVIVWAEERQTTIQRLQRALNEFQIGGIPTDIELLLQIIDSEHFNQGSANTTYLETFQFVPNGNEETLKEDMALAAALLAHQSLAHPQIAQSHNIASGWQSQAWKEQMRYNF